MICRICKKDCSNLIKGICLDCLDKYPKTFEINSIPRAIYVKECKEHGVYLGSGNRQVCPICYSKTVYCKYCGKEIKGIHINDNRNHFCSSFCQRKEIHLKNSKPGKCIKCGNFVKKRSVVGLCSECSIKHSKNICKNNKSPGKCSICNIFNEIRDQNGRGISHCNCSKEWYIKHNSSEKMIKQAMEVGKNYGIKNLKYANYEIKYCEKCNIETPHKNNECLNCKGTHIWCEHCQKWETKSYNSIKLHWKHYKSNIRNWMSDENNIQLIELLKSNIRNFKSIDTNTAICGIYCWFIDDIPYYIGQSTDILTRSYEHMMEIVESPEYWLNIVDNLNSHILSIKVLEECDIKDLNNREKYWINYSGLNPISQKCDGTDRIIPLNERNFSLDNL